MGLKIGNVRMWNSDVAISNKAGFSPSLDDAREWDTNYVGFIALILKG